MVSPLNRFRLDPSYNASFEDDAENNILAQYTAFKKGSDALVMAFKQVKDRYGSIHNIPLEILQKFNIPFKSLLDISENLRGVLQSQVNKNTKDLKDICDQGGVDTAINNRIFRKREKLYQMIEYFDEIEILSVAIEFCMEAK